MDDRLDPFLYDEWPSEADVATLQEVLDANSELARQWRCWVRVRARLRKRVRDCVPDRRLLVLYALDQAGAGGVLSATEHEALASTRDDIDAALRAMPALRDVVERIQDEHAAFEAVWAQHRGEGAAPVTEEGTPRSRPERSPRASRSHTATERRWVWRLTVAALLLGAAVLALVYGPQQTERTTVTAAAGEHKTIPLPDGSTVRLAGQAAVSYTPGMDGAQPQRVRLARGKAYFTVPAGRKAPFVVRTPAARAEVLGTQFGVVTGSDSTEVVLVDGAVRVGTGDEADEASSVVLRPGQRSLVRRGQAPAAPAPADLTAALAWSGLFVFRSTPTATIAQRLQQHYGGTIRVAPALADEPVTGTFDREQSVRQVLVPLAQTLGAEVRREGEDVYRLVPIN
mgnify:CR=1 FL=1|jgi:ferric-dicitrate binding protein FerR (iron transport regulator)